MLRSIKFVNVCFFGGINSKVKLRKCPFGSRWRNIIKTDKIPLIWCLCENAYLEKIGLITIMISLDCHHFINFIKYLQKKVVVVLSKVINNTIFIVRKHIAVIIVISKHIIIFLLCKNSH